MSKCILNKRIRFCMALFLLIAMLTSLLSDFPLELPQENGLQYSTGFFEIEKASEATNHILLRKVNGSSNYQVFSCSYSPFSNQRASTCGDDKHLESYVDKEATIGWYKIDEFIGFKNDVSQLVTIEINNEIIRSYENTNKKVTDRKIGSLYIFLPVAFVISLVSYWFLGKVR